jgi:GNAT superfamily N-acetyltransferase
MSQTIYHAWLDRAIRESAEGQVAAGNWPAEGAALEALHAWAKVHGYERVGLHVFGSNDTARRLYDRAGYVETDVVMEKRL